MKTTEDANGTETQQLCDRLAKGIAPTSEERKAARERINRIREENFKLLGLQNVTLDAIRQSREGR